MESLVVTVDTAKKLKASGFPQNTAFTWGQDALGKVAIVHYGAENDGWLNQWAAPTSQEIANQQPHVLEKHFYATNDGAKHHWFYRASTTGAPGREVDGDTMAEATAALWLKLQEAK